MNMFKRIELFLVGVLFFSCGSSPDSSQVTQPDNPPPASVSPMERSVAEDLDAVIRETSDYLNRQLLAGNKLIILNVQSEFPALSEYIIDELIANTVNDRVFSVVDRQQLNTIRQELNFQFSGEVDDETAQALGRMAGAQIIVSGAVSKIGNMYRLRVRALRVQSAEIEGQFNRNIPDDPTLQALVQSKATGYGEEPVITNSQPGAKPASTPVKQVPTPARSGAVYNGNGHSYEVVNITMSWINAKRYCEERGGYLMTITSPGEQTFIENLLAFEGNKRFYWIGGYCTSDRKFQWVTGERFDYTNWMRGEPNNDGGREDKLQIILGDHPNVSNSSGKWNDAFNELNTYNNIWSNLGFICEFD